MSQADSVAVIQKFTNWKELTSNVTAGVPRLFMNSEEAIGIRGDGSWEYTDKKGRFQAGATADQLNTYLTQLSGNQK